MKLASYKSVLNPPVVYSSDRSKAVVPVLALLFDAVWFILRGDFFVCLTLCHFVLVFFSPFSIAITSLGEERANLTAFCMFDRFVLVWICRFPLPLGLGRVAVCDCSTPWTFLLPFYSSSLWCASWPIGLWSSVLKMLLVANNIDPRPNHLGNNNIFLRM